MLGSFFELSVWSRDVAASAAFWEGLGFTQGVVGDTWPHRCAVLHDDRLALGLHAYEFDSPSLTWVRPGLAEALPELRALGLAFEFAKTGPDEFHEAGFRDPAGQVVTLLEARTWSPGPTRPPLATLLGHFREYRYATADPAAVTAFWETLGLVQDLDGPRAIATGITLAPRSGLGAPVLAFEQDDLAAAAARLGERGYAVDADAGVVRLGAPDGLQIVIESAEG
ncbi:hypothetical protein [Wenzhouxiangella sp. XN24]|uniref:VOC family protein n=1 Tax=Wenzhouxiangella sp. XN24 TaxID=2713569 RepID=UPI0013EABC30|nr:hypothetical protein [Wenzhouxiangella sp. XN24]NGX17639.1 hypothetical protein [Wenzhouxiangella sp. XN24]